MLKLLACTEEGTLSLACSANPPSFINLLVAGSKIPENYYINIFSPFLLINTFHTSLLISESLQIIRSPNLNEANGRDDISVHVIQLCGARGTRPVEKLDSFLLNGRNLL